MVSPSLHPPEDAIPAPLGGTAETCHRTVPGDLGHTLGGRLYGDDECILRRPVLETTGDEADEPHDPSLGGVRRGDYWFS